jgi:hypothetical protein
MRIHKNTIVATFVLSLFTDPSIVPKYLGLPADSYVVFVACLIVWQICAVVLGGSFQVKRQLLGKGKIILIYASTSIGYRYLFGQTVGDLSLHIIALLNLILFMLLVLNDLYTRSVVLSIYLAGFLHLLTLFNDPLGLRSNLTAALSGYEFGAGGLSSSARRETGLFPAPAMLVAFSIVLLNIAVFDILNQRRRMLSYFGIATSMILGIATFNRSFIMGLLAAVVLLKLYARNQKSVLFVVGLSAVVLIVGISGEYAEFVGNRFVMLIDSGIDATQRWTGDTGILTGLDIFWRHPWFGNPTTPNGGTLVALGNEQQFVNPHNGLALILAVYGLIGGAPIILMYIFSLIAATSSINKSIRFKPRGMIDWNHHESKVLFGVISLSILPINMVEPLPEYGLILVMSIAPYLQQYNSKDIS